MSSEAIHIARSFVLLCQAKTGMDTTNLARAAGVAPSTLNRFMNDDRVKHALSLKTLLKLSNASGVPIPDGLSGAAKSYVPIVGYVGAGAVIHPVDDHAMGQGLEEVEAPPGHDGEGVALVVRGDSMRPLLRDGDVIHYRRRMDMDEAECLGQLCVVQVVDGATYVKEMVRGSRPDTYTLLSMNAGPLHDVEVQWAAPVGFIDMRRRFQGTN